MITQETLKSVSPFEVRLQISLESVGVCRYTYKSLRVDSSNGDAFQHLVEKRMKEIGYREVQEKFGIKKWKLQRWIKKGLIDPTTNSFGGRKSDGSYRTRLFSRFDLIDIKCVDDLYNQGFRAGKIRRIIHYIRSKKYRLDKDLYQTDGISIWSRENLDSSDGMLTQCQKRNTIFLPWKKLTNEVDQIIA